MFVSSLAVQPSSRFVSSRLAQRSRFRCTNERTNEAGRPTDRAGIQRSLASFTSFRMTSSPAPRTLLSSSPSHSLRLDGVVSAIVVVFVSFRLSLSRRRHDFVERLVAREMSNELDAHRLIAEVRKRPPLWDVRMAEYKDRTNTPHLWGEIAELLGVDVEQCKRKWKNLRDAYRAEVRRSDRRVARLKALGQYDPQRRGHSKWVYFEPMNFINESKRTSYAGAAANAAAAATAAGAENRRRTRSSMGPMEAEAEAEAEGEGEGEGNCGSAEDPIFVPGFHSFCDIKMETHHTTDDDVDGDEVDDEDEDDQLFEEFAAVATPQAARRLSDCIAANAAAAAAVAAEVNQTRASPTGTGIGSGNGSAARCKCSKRADEQVHFLEDLEREEQQLMQSTRKEITRANSVGHVGDADYNFLVSFLPQMKKMTELQNLQFRARMSELLLNTMSTPSPCAVAAAAAAARLGVVAVPKSMVQQQMASTVSSSQQLLPKEEEEREAIRTLTSRTQSQLRDLDDKML